MVRLITAMFGVLAGTLIAGWLIGETPEQALAAALMNVVMFGWGAQHGRATWGKGRVNG